MALNTTILASVSRSNDCPADITQDIIKGTVMTPFISTKYYSIPFHRSSSSYRNIQHQPVAIRKIKITRERFKNNSRTDHGNNSLSRRNSQRWNTHVISRLNIKHGFTATVRARSEPTIHEFLNFAATFFELFPPPGIIRNLWTIF